jgi:sugar lactone lactonase YvrE
VGRTDGTGAAARFTRPQGVATDSAGNLYVADTSNDAIRKITPAGVVSTLAGTAGIKGSSDGTGAAARFQVPFGVTTDSAGNIYVADTFNGTIRKITPAGVVTTLAGTAGVEGSTDGTGAAARFSDPFAVATDSAGNVYVADNGSNTIRKITPAGVVTTFAGTAGLTGSTDGTGAAARFNLPHGVAVDSASNVYVADSRNNTIRKITPAGMVTTLAGKAGVEGSTDGTGAAARFNLPDGVAVDSASNVYVADYGNHTIRKITPSGMVSTVVGVAGKPDFVPGALPGRIGYPVGVAVSGTSLFIMLYNGVAVVQNRP